MGKQYGVWAYDKNGFLVQKGEAEVMSDGKTLEIRLFNYPRATAYVCPIEEEDEDATYACSETPQFSDRDVTKPIWVPH